MLPLYKMDEKPKKYLNSNAGLWFERFFDEYNDNANDLKPELDKKDQGKNFWLQKFKKAGNTEALQQAACQQMDLIKQLNGKHKFFNTQWHFITGIGYPHPVENGLLWHQVQGVPYLSGAAVKGLVRAWVEEWEFAVVEGESEEDEFTREAEKRKQLLSWFGSDNKKADKQQNPSQAGDIIFFDALPVKEVSLVTDIMTPHYGKWYNEGGSINNIKEEPQKIPADWHDPVPIPFLVVDKASSYLFSIAPRNIQAAERVDMQKVIDCLTQALEWLGAGAKTATGYGGFIKHDKHPLGKQWLAINQSFDEELAEMTEAEIIVAFSKNYNATKTRFEQNWQQAINVTWQNHEEKIKSWESSNNKNQKKAYKNLIRAKG